jgi:hypothetical protein
MHAYAYARQHTSAIDSMSIVNKAVDNAPEDPRLDAIG